MPQSGGAPPSPTPGGPNLSLNFRNLVSVIAAAAMLNAQAVPRAVAAELSRSDYESCATRDEDGLSGALTTISSDALKAGLGKVDYPALVADAWRKHNVDDIIDKRVDIAVEEVKAEIELGRTAEIARQRRGVAKTRNRSRRARLPLDPGDRGDRTLSPRTWRATSAARWRPRVRRPRGRCSPASRPSSDRATVAPSPRPLREMPARILASIRRRVPGNRPPAPC